MRTRYRIPRRHPMTKVSLGFMTTAILVRLLCFALSPALLAPLWLHLLLPVAASVLFLFTVPLCGETNPRWTAVSVWVGVVFFFLKSFTFATVLHTVLCILLYLTVLTLYTLTIFGVIPTKKLLYPLFGLPLAYHILVEDMQIYILASEPVPFVQWLPEISVLCIMAALLTLALGMEKVESAKNTDRSLW